MDHIMNYDDVMKRLKIVFERNGAKEDKENPFFQKAKLEDLECLLHVYDYFTHWTNIYLNDELAVIKDLVIPTYIIDFYKNYEPCHQPMTEAGIYLFDLKRIQEENSNSVLLKYKLLTIACTIGGDSVCLDLNQEEPSVVLIDHTEIPFVEEVEKYFPTYDDIKSIIHLVSESFREFLWKYSGDEYGDLEDEYL